jgi:hypothetical protein
MLLRLLQKTNFHRNFQYSYHNAKLIPRVKNVNKCYNSGNMSNNQELTVDKLHELTKETVESATTYVPGRSELEKKEWCVKRLSQVLETFDNYIPVIGIFLDNPIADDFEEQMVRLLVDWGWAKYMKEDTRTENLDIEQK